MLANQVTEIRDPTNGAKSVDTSTVSADVRVLLATPVGQRDEHISKADLATLLGIIANANAISTLQTEVCNTYVLATMDW